MEAWKDIPGYSGAYQASSEGRIRSRDRLVYQPTVTCRNGLVRRSCYRSVKGTVLKPAATGSGRLAVMLGRRRNLEVHIGVALAFHGVKPHWAQDVAHRDGNFLNNRPENLRWATRSSNNFDITQHGRRQLTPDNVTQVRLRLLTLAGQYGRYSTVAREFGVRPSTIWKIAHGRLYGGCDVVFRL